MTLPFISNHHHYHLISHVFVSGCATIESQQYALGDLGAADFIEKPFDSSDFVSRILSLIEDTATA